jgi:hypothetical protein
MKLTVFALTGWLAMEASLHGAAPSSGSRVSTAAAAVVRFFPPGGVYTNNLNVHLSAESGVIHFTVDGSEPTPDSPRYNEPIRIPGCIVIKAKVFGAPSPATGTVAQSYTVLSSDLRDFTSNLPLIIVNTLGQRVDNLSRVNAAVRFNESRQGRTSLLSEASFDGLVSMKVRGHSSLRYPKRSFSLKTIDASGGKVEASILGLPSDNDWILYAPYPDKSLLRDVLAYEMSNQMGHWAARTRFCEVFVNGSGGKLSRRHYVGVYVFEEKIKRDGDRVNIAKLEPTHDKEPEITGGYIFKKDHMDRGFMMEDNLLGIPPMRGGSSGRSYLSGPGGFPADPAGFRPPRNRPSAGRRRVYVGPDGEQRVIEEPIRPPPSRPADPARVGTFELLLRDLLGGPQRRGRATQGDAFTTRQGNTFFYEEPEADKIPEVQRRWLANYLDEFERALYGPDFQDAMRGYRAYIDVDSFIDQHLIVEVTKNIDGFRFSAFYHKDRGGKLKMQPIWDWNLSFGNANGKEGWLTTHWYWPQLDDQQYSWFRRLFEDPDFGQRYVDRYAELRKTVFAPEKITARVDELAKLLSEAQARNFERWPIIDQKVWPNYYVFGSYGEEIDFIKQWISRRIDWIDQQFLQAPKIAANSSGTVEITVPAGRIHYTLDGSDPRAPGGEVAPEAKLYRGPLNLKAGDRVVARAQQDARWSSPALKQF